ncbi:hypothetical protein BGX34_004739 [Mortierella sp. NVP85]|nr:hypothetical protein BGX34_004739 [Mortierella sp. NVP85]
MTVKVVVHGLYGPILRAIIHQHHSTLRTRIDEALEHVNVQGDEEEAGTASRNAADSHSTQPLSTEGLSKFVVVQPGQFTDEIVDDEEAGIKNDEGDKHETTTTESKSDGDKDVGTSTSAEDQPLEEQK